ncbi:hypothetical protein BDN72DRAFT_861192 [Pluteus cervinus]|uniref:Uncharacterized protein n=1 Tax=Pluteus cervinus TaxID=181527 RepID=A0ACD3AG95_9AGAR|nr:hypothetical protein BDN72DRAFT_861192 [Pluteus cervinus]
MYSADYEAAALQANSETEGAKTDSSSPNRLIKDIASICLWRCCMEFFAAGKTLLSSGQAHLPVSKAAKTPGTQAVIRPHRYKVVQLLYDLWNSIWCWLADHGREIGVLPNKTFKNEEVSACDTKLYETGGYRVNDVTEYLDAHVQSGPGETKTSTGRWDERPPLDEQVQVSLITYYDVCARSSTTRVPWSDLPAVTERDASEEPSRHPGDDDLPDLVPLSDVEDEEEYHVPGKVSTLS